ncbi:MAG TPA: phage integrase SAM-like domain-containing protein [Flavobacterium sp.]|jgi:hypothetical protein
MATVNFLYRSTLKESNLTLRLLFREQDKDHVIDTKTRLEVGKYFWEKLRAKKGVKDTVIRNQQITVEDELNRLEKHILSEFTTAKENITKKWLEAAIDLYYNPQLKEIIKSDVTDLKGFIEVYVNEKKSGLSPGTVKTCNVIKNRLAKYELEREVSVLIKDVDLDFKLDFERFCIDHSYAPNTIARSIKFFKTVCLYARSKRIETNYQLDSIKVGFKKTESIYLNLDEIKLIKALDPAEVPEYLLNARDWLIISCFTGQRISDFMRFEKSMISTKLSKTGKINSFIDFVQAKTGKKIRLLLLPEVVEIIRRLHGNFPRAISDQKYNKYIKEVCKRAGITSEINGSKRTELSSGSKIYRSEAGVYKKYELVASHIGRRSFATNYYGHIPTPILMNATGHSTEAMFLNYIGKASGDYADALAEYFN